MANTVWVITGASSGFGEGIAYAALANGGTVIATARRAAKLENLRKAGAKTLDVDVTSDFETLKSIASKVAEEYGQITHLINTAGYVLEAAVEETSQQEAYDQFNTNVFGSLNITRAFLPYLRKQPGSVVALFGSLAGWVPGPAFVVYAATKSAITCVAEGLRDELEPFGVQACVIEPGYFRSNLLNSGAKIKSEIRMKEYDDTVVGQARKALDEANQQQPGDISKGSKVIVDVLTSSGVAKGRNVPVRLVLGSDCQEGIRTKIKDTIALLDDWKEISESTDY